MHLQLSTLALAASILSSTGLVHALSAQDIPADTPVSALLTSAQAHLSNGQTTDALVYYDAAIVRDPQNYLTFFKRATTYLSLGRTYQATDDFNKVLSLQPGFEGAHVQLGKIKARGAEWDAARQQYLLAGKQPGSPELDQLTEAQGAAGLAERAVAEGDWEECVTQAGVAIIVANRAASLRELRARCRFEKGEVEEGMSDLQHVLQMKSGDITPHVKISATTFYGLGDTTRGMAQLKRCLHSDPENKVCSKLLKQEKKIEKILAKVNKFFERKQPVTGAKSLVASGDDKGLIQEVKEQVKTFKEEGIIPEKAPDMLLAQLLELACQAYYDMKSKKAGKYCTEALKVDQQSFYGLLHKAQQQLEAEELEACLETLENAQEAKPDKQDVVQPLLQEAKIALKRSKTKDYYKVLGVEHDADERQIKSAYRKLTRVHHPDKAVKQGLTKEAAEKKMQAINEAYEVLSNPELRARFDHGDDPNSHDQHGGGQGFHGQPFVFQQGGPQFNFKFGSGGGGGGFPGGFPFGG